MTLVALIVATRRFLACVIRARWGRRRNQEEEQVRTAHLSYLHKFFPHHTIFFGWLATPSMRASKVVTPDGSREVIVTTLLLDGKIYHETERTRPRSHHAPHN